LWYETTPVRVERMDSGISQSCKAWTSSLSGLGNRI
jgi:hypothetical protein